MYQPNPLYLPDRFFLKKQNQGFSPRSERSFPRDIKKLYNETCCITGLTKETHKLQAHHLYSRKDNPGLSFCLYNAIVLETSIHKKYHKYFGVDSTPAQFIAFIKIYNQLASNELYPLYADPARLEALIGWISILDYEIKQLSKPF